MFKRCPYCDLNQAIAIRAHPLPPPPQKKEKENSFEALKNILLVAKQNSLSF